MNKSRVAIIIVLDVVVWGLVAWLIFSRDPYKPIEQGRVAYWWKYAEMCRGVAYDFGREAIRAENNYWKAVKSNGHIG